MDLKERVAYLQGMAAGFKFNGSSKEEKIMLGILEVLSEMAGKITDIETNYDEIEEYIECLDEDLSEVEAEIFGDYEEDDDDYDYDDDECCCCGCEDDSEFDDDDEVTKDAE